VTTQQYREQQKQQRAQTIWLTGLSGAGKSTIAMALDERLCQQGLHTYVLDGDNLRQGLCSDLDFSEQSRSENIRRVAEVAKLFNDAGIIVITAFISPFAKDRQRAKAVIGAARFLEVYCAASIDVCEHRDVKGLYQRARLGDIPLFTGISSPYEAPVDADVVLQTGRLSVDVCVDRLMALFSNQSG